MELTALLAMVGDDPALAGTTVDGAVAGVEIAGVDHDSRVVGPGALFCCVPGGHADGHDHAAAAVAAGAAALLVERRLRLGVPEVQVRSTRAAMGPLAAAVSGHPSRRMSVIGVTGTNGKTTTVHLLQAILGSAGVPCGVIGTLTGARTTPEAPELQRSLASMADRGDRAVAVEVSSHALELHRVDGTSFAVAVFTNLSPEHLDFHGDMDAYFAAKARLFAPALTARAVVNADDPYGRALLAAAAVPAVPFSLDDVSDLVTGPAGSSFTWRGHAVRMPMAGRFNVANALAAATAAVELGVELPAVAAGLAGAPAVDGRFELIDQGQPFMVVVDYAHTPDGLRQVLGTARELAAGNRVTVVFGAGGDRDRTKRPAMGEVVASAADVAIVTTDNPRREDPAKIVAGILDGLRLGPIPDERVVVEPDRRAAIALALAGAAPGDVVVVAGKGHETTQTVGDRTLAFDDRTVARELLQEVTGR